MEEILKVEGLKTSFMTSSGEVQAVRGVSFTVHKGEILGIVGESGSGKSVTSMTILRLLADTARIKEGSIQFEGKDLTKCNEKEMRAIRGQKIAMIFQDPMSSLNPLIPVGRQVEEMMKIHHPELKPEELKQRTLELFEQVRIPEPEKRLKSYPHEFSGGMRQRVMIAMALANHPDLLIADEPTTALDVTIQDQILKQLRELRADHLNDLYTLLGQDGQNKRGGKLSAKTILEHHRLISTVLEQAVKEGLVPFNVASRATLPKAEHKEVNYFQPEQVAAIRDALELEPMKWKMLVHLLLITGARRGEVLGLKWDKVDFEGNRIYICNSILYSPDIGIYESTPKTERSRRYITLPAETMQLLRQYRNWQASERLRLGEYYVNQNFVFSQDNGNPMHPDSVTDYLKKFSKRHDLPHINPHAFRHTMASMLYFNGVDSVSISKRLGHAQVSTTANIYAHVMEEADQRNADILSDIFLKKA